MLLYMANSNQSQSEDCARSHIFTSIVRRENPPATPLQKYNSGPKISNDFQLLDAVISFSEVSSTGALSSTALT